jgi:hypothetical protein
MGDRAETGFALAAAPFLAAVATHFGNQLAGTLDGRTRRAVRRFLRRQVEAAPQSPRPAPGHFYLLANGGRRVQMSINMPAEALAQLPDVLTADPPSSADPMLMYDDGWHMVGDTDAGLMIYRWDPEAKHWEDTLN